MNLEIDSKDVIRLMLQFMKENNLIESAKILQKESGVALNSVDNIDNFISDIHQGKWENILPTVSEIALPQEKSAALYEQVVLELLENNERDLAREVLRSSDPLKVYKVEEPQRYLKLEHLCQRPYFNATDAYETSSKEKRRYDLAESLASEVTVVPQSRLLSIITQALRYQESQGLLPKGSSYDLFSGGRKATVKDTEDKVPKKLAGQIKFTPESHPETLVFAPDGISLITGSVDGFIEVWDYESCKLRKDLDYQARDELMMHDDAVLCACFSKDGEFLVTGSQGGQLKIWKINSGKCLKKFTQAHASGITSVSFSKDNTQLLTSSYDQTARIHGLKSGKTIKEFRGHVSYVNCAIYVRDYSNVITVSSDGTCKIWDIRTSENLLSFRPDSTTTREVSLINIMQLPNSSGPIAYLLTLQGQIVQTYNSFTTSKGDFLSAAVSNQGKWLYCVGEDGNMYVFDVREGKLEETIKVDDKEVIAVFHHPHRNMLGTTNDEGFLKIWRA